MPMLWSDDELDEFYESNGYDEQYDESKSKKPKYVENVLIKTSKTLNS